MTDRAEIATRIAEALVRGGKLHWPNPNDLANAYAEFACCVADAILAACPEPARKTVHDPSCGDVRQP